VNVVEAALEPRLQDTAASDFEGPEGLAGLGVLGAPRDTPPEITTVVEGVAGRGTASASPPILKVGALGFNPVGRDLLPNLPPRAAVIGAAPISVLSSTLVICSERIRDIAGTSNVVCEGPAVDGIREPVLTTRFDACRCPLSAIATCCCIANSA
jgi:hypothetical protein